MQNVLQKIQALQETLKGLTMKPEHQKALDKKFRLEFNYNSNHIEGNTLTYGETELLLIFDDTRGNHTMREYEEMKAHDVAFELVKEWAADPEHVLTENNIRQLNEIILVRPFWKEAITPDGQNTRRLIEVGEYKKHPNSVRLQNGEIFDYASPTDTPIKMGELIAWYREEESNKEMHPVALAALLHYKFVCIHPFDDGNGRVSRLLMNYVLLKNGLPPVVIKTAEKQNYLAALHSADTGDLNSFVKYIGEQAVWSLELSVKAGRGESLDEPDDLDKELFILQRELRSEDIIKATATTETTCHALEANIIPLFKLIVEKCNYLEEFFLNINRNVNFDIIKAEGNIASGQIENDIVGLSEWISNYVIPRQATLRKVRFDLDLQGFKKHISAMTWHISVEVHFNPYNYSIETHINRDTPLRLPYGTKLSPEEISKIAYPLVQHVVEGIKRMNQSNK